MYIYKPMYAWNDETVCPPDHGFMLTWALDMHMVRK